MKKNRIVSIVLMIVMIMSLVPSVYAEGEPDYGKILSFEDLRKAIKTTKSSFDTDEDKDLFRQTYWKPVLPDKSKAVYPKGDKLEGEYIGINNESVDAFKIFYYGYGSLIQDNTSDSNGNKNYLGYTADGRHVVNMLYNETNMENPKKEPIDKYFKHLNVKYYGRVRPFRTQYTDPLKVGEMYLGKEASKEDKEQYGKLIILEWMKHITVRDTGWGKKGQTFYQVFGGNVDEFAKYVAITSPPTSRSNGQATMWFISDNGVPENKMPNGKYQTRRTFVIEKTDPVDFIVKEGDYAWDESTKTLTVRYEVEGLEIIKGNVGHRLMKYVDKGNIVVEKDDSYRGLKSFFNKETKELIFLDEEVEKIKKGFVENDKNGIDADIAVYNIKDNIDSKYLNKLIINRFFKVSNGSVTEGFFTHDKCSYIKPELIYVNGEPQRKIKHEVKFRLPYLPDMREYPITFNYVVNGPFDVVVNKSDIIPYFSEQSKTSKYPYKNNMIDIVIPPTCIDFILTHDNDETKKEIRVVGDEDVKVPIHIELGGLSGDKVDKGEVIKTDVVIFNKEGKVVETLKDVEFTKEDLVEGALAKDLDIMIKKDLIKQGENKFYIVINSNFNLTEAKPIKEEYNLKNNKIEIVILKGEEDFEIIANKHKIEVDKEDKGEIELSYNVNLKGTEKEIPTVVDLYRGDKVIESINIKSKGGTSQEVKFKVPIVILEEGINNFYGVVNADYNLKEARPFGIIKK
ncbi:hypothetical protein [Sporanaerobacter acetigenes]|uniref:hypothetical protein n=1 Tax=Sporanaerobacter acetigenes TaxID=165813 RepID=UPI001049347A|nr:hypothetical protein [Sporanaerobacter acetigenes]